MSTICGITPTNRGPKNHVFGRLRNLTATLTACIFSKKHDIDQGCPTGGPRVASGPRPLLIRPATTLQRTLFTDLCFTVIFTRTWLRYVRVFAVAIPSVVCRLSVICNVGAPYSGGWTFRQNFFTAVYAGHPLTSMQNFTEIVLGEPLRRER